MNIIMKKHQTAALKLIEHACAPAEGGLMVELQWAGGNSLLLTPQAARVVVQKYDRIEFSPIEKWDLSASGDYHQTKRELLMMESIF